MTTPSSMAASRFITTALGRIRMVLVYQPGGPGSSPARIIYFCHAFIHFFLCYGVRKMGACPGLAVEPLIPFIVDFLPNRLSVINK